MLKALLVAIQSESAREEFMSTAFRVVLEGDQEVPPTGSMASGFGTVIFDSTEIAASYSFRIEGVDYGPVTGLPPQTPTTLDDVTATHFHNEVRGVNGAVVFGQIGPAQDPDDFAIVANADGSWTLSGRWETTDPANVSIANFATVLGSAPVGSEVPLYFNVHTTQFPGGEIRGQLVAFTLLPQGEGHFDADQSGGRLLRHDDGTFRIDDINALQVTTHVLGAVGAEWSFLGTGDFNGNGISDMLSQRFSDGMLLTHTIDANQVVGSSLLGAIGSEWNFLGIGDFNHDATSDLLWQDTDGTLLTHNINNNQVMGSAFLGQIGSEWNFLATDDFNQDGTSDLLWQRTDGTLLIHNINNNQASGSATLGQIGSEWHFAGTGDFNGDDASDLLWQRHDGTLLVHNLNNNQVTNAQVVETLALGTHRAGIDDYTGDGTDDLVVRHHDGRFELHQIQANAVTQTVNLGLVTNDWHVI
jgi:CHRD domain